MLLTLAISTIRKREIRYSWTPSVGESSNTKASHIKAMAPIGSLTQKNVLSVPLDQ